MAIIAHYNQRWDDTPWPRSGFIFFAYIGVALPRLVMLRYRSRGATPIQAEWITLVLHLGLWYMLLASIEQKSK